jgi:selenocysteine lyase/cysteine desulfurase
MSVAFRAQAASFLDANSSDEIALMPSTTVGFNEVDRARVRSRHRVARG